MNLIKNLHRRSLCRACNSTNLELYYSLKPSPIGDAFISKDKLNLKQEIYPIDLYICKDCFFFQLLDIINPDILYADYIYETKSSVGLKEHFNNYSDHILKIITTNKNSLVVDVGSNDGMLLNFFKLAGMRTVGIEPASKIAKIANDKGIETYSNYFCENVVNKILEKHGKAKIITSNNVFANVDDIQNWTKCVKNLLDEDGIYIFESYYLLDLINNFVFDFIYHEHLSAFSVKPLKSFFESFDMKLIRIEPIKTKGGSLRFYVIKKSNTNIRNSLEDHSVEKYIDLEEKKKLYEKNTFDIFLNKIDNLKIQLLEFLKEAKKQKKKIAGFGASITGTTLIYHFELGNFIDYLIDDNTAKHGTYSPGLHLPVYSTEKIELLKPDIIILLAWRFSDIFIKKVKRINWSGEIIKPVPDFELFR